MPPRWAVRASGPRTWFHVTVGVLLGAITSIGELVFVAYAGLGRLWPGRARQSAKAFEQARRIADAERRRLATFFGANVPPAQAHLGTLTYLAARSAVGLLGGLVLLAGVIGMLYASFPIWGWLVNDFTYPSSIVIGTLGGIFLTFLCFQGVLGVASLEAQVAARFLGSDDVRDLQRRVGELATSRAGVVAVVHDERKRIERDLHDGVQQRLVALGLLIGRARRTEDPAHADELLEQAHEHTQTTLAELREVAWRIYPTNLDDAGLAAAIESIAERSDVPVDVTYNVPEPLPVAVQTVVYFVVAEAVTNALKHTEATRITVQIRQEHDVVRARVEDNGAGGADPDGAGLVGLARRVAAVDGTLRIDSPDGGPTALTAEIPCG